MKKFAPFLLIPLIISIFAAIGIFENSALRLPHPDESEQAHTLKNLESKGEYFYNPKGPHGPTLYYFALFSKNVFSKFSAGNQIKYRDDILGAKTCEIKTLRECVFPFFVFILLAYVLAQRPIGAALFGAMFFSLSSLASIYSTYFVHEVIFAFFIFALSTAAWKFAKSPSAGWAALLGIFAGLAQCTKETAPIFFFAIALAGVAVKYCASRKHEGKKAKTLTCEIFQKKRDIARCAIVFIFCFAAVFTIFYSSFFQNPKGICDAFESYFHFAEKAQSDAHYSPWTYYLELFTLKKSGGVWFGELPIFMLAVLGALWAFFGKQKNREDGFDKKNFAKYNALIAIVCLLVFSSIKYKTPWLMLAPSIFICAIAGSACDALLSFGKGFLYKAVILCILLALAFWQFKLSQNASKKFHSDPRNPFIYSHTTSGIKRAVNRVSDALKVSEYGGHIPVATVMLDAQTSPWPLPWYFDRLENSGFWNSQNLPEHMGIFEVLILDMRAKFPECLDKENYVEEWGGLRENLGLVIYTKKNIFDKIVE